jgi:hypothetical protein
VDSSEPNVKPQNKRLISQAVAFEKNFSVEAAIGAELRG